MSRPVFSAVRNALLFSKYAGQDATTISARAMSPRVPQLRMSSTVSQIMIENEEHLPTKEELEDRVHKFQDKVPPPKYEVVLHIPRDIKKMCFDAAVSLVEKGGGFANILKPENVKEHAANLSLELNKLARQGDYNAIKMLEVFRKFASDKTPAVVVLDQLPIMALTQERVSSLGIIPVVSPIASSSSGAIQMDNAMTLQDETRIAAAQHLPNAFFSFAALLACGKGRPEDIYCMRRADGHRLGSEGVQYPNMGGFGLCGIEATGSLKTVIMEADQVLPLLTPAELECLQRPVFYVGERLYNFQGDGTHTFPALSKDAAGKWQFRYSDNLLISNFKGLSAQQTLETAIAIENINVMAEILLAKGKVFYYGVTDGDILFADSKHLVARVDSHGKIADIKKGQEVQILTDGEHKPRRVMMVRATMDGVPLSGKKLPGVGLE